MASASRALTRALRPLARQLPSSVPKPALQRTFVTALGASSKRAIVAAPKCAGFQTRGVKTIDFAGVPETVYGEFGASQTWNGSYC